MSYFYNLVPSAKTSPKQSQISENSHLIFIMQMLNTLLI